MAATRLSTKGQLVIPKEIRARLGWSPGAELEVEAEGDHLIVRAAGQIPEATLEDLVGCAGYRGPARSLAEMQEAIARGARERR